MQTKACPFFPIATWPLGNCLSSNFGSVPAERELCFYNLLHITLVTCLQHVMGLIFPPATQLLTSCQSTSGCQALPPQSIPQHAGMCVCVCGHVLLQRGYSQGWLERENSKKQELVCVQENLCSHHAEQTKQNGRCAILRVQMWKVMFALTESSMLRACSWFTQLTVNQT